MTMKLYLIFAVMIPRLICAAGVEEMPDSEFVPKFVVPEIHRFVAAVGTNIVYPEIDLAKATRKRVERLDGVGPRVFSEVYLRDRYMIFVKIDGTNTSLMSYDITPSPANRARNANPAAAKHYAAMTNQFTWDTAVAFGWNFLAKIGTDTNNFRLRLEESEQHQWAAHDDDPAPIKLPFYELVFWRKDLTSVPAHEPIYPHIRMIVDGTTKRVLHYRRLYLPVVGDFGAWKPDLKPAATNAPAK